MAKYILSIDVGTSSIKAAVVDSKTGEILSPIGRAPFDLDHPTPDASEISVFLIWNAISMAVRQITSLEIGKKIQGIGISCLTPALVLLNENDEPLTSVWTHLDRRSRGQARRVWEEVGEEFLKTNGNRPLPGGISALCFREIIKENPQIESSVCSYLHLNSWIAFHMTGQKAFDPANASFSGLFPLTRKNEWSSRWCDYFEVKKEWLPAVSCGTSTVGSLRDLISEELGLPPRLPLKLGTADTTSAMLSQDFTQHDLLHVVGTTQVLLNIVEEPRPSEHRLTRRLGIGEAFVHVTHNPVSGAALEWMHRLCFSDQSPQKFFSETVPSLSEKETSIVLEPPFIGGDRLEIETCFAGFKNLNLWTQREDLLTALIQAMRKSHSKALHDLGTRTDFSRVYLTGGGAVTVRDLLPQYQQKNSKMELHLFEEGSLRGVGRLF